MDLNSPVGPHFARARYFLVVDIDTSAFSFRNNTDLQQITYLAVRRLLVRSLAWASKP